MSHNLEVRLRHRHRFRVRNCFLRLIDENQENAGNYDAH